jgi:hypothetical protein
MTHWQHVGAGDTDARSHEAKSAGHTQKSKTRSQKIVLYEALKGAIVVIQKVGDKKR